MMNSTKKVTHIQVDASEATSGIPRRLAAIDGVSVSESRLDCGDYICSDTVVVERKTATDFIASIMDRRLFEQVANMAGAFERSILLLEGDPYATRSGIAPAALDGAFSWVATLSSVTMIPSSGIEHSVRLIATIARHAQHGLGYEIPLRAGKPKAVELQRQFLIEGLPGIGPEGRKSCWSTSEHRWLFSRRRWSNCRTSLASARARPTGYSAYCVNQQAKPSAFPRGLE